MSTQEIFEQTTEKLQNINTLKYTSIFINRNPYGSINKIDTSTWFFDFSSTDTIIGTKYLKSMKEKELGFYGKNAFYIFNDKQILAHRPAYSIEDMISGVDLTYTIYGMRKLFPIFLKNSAFSICNKPDTLLNNTPYYHMKILMNRK